MSEWLLGGVVFFLGVVIVTSGISIVEAVGRWLKRKIG